MDEIVKELRHIDEFAKEINRPTSGIFREAADAIEQLTADLERSKEWEAFWEKEANEALKKFQTTVASLPRWIPVDEQLPEEAGKYLVCGRWRGEPTKIWVCEFMTIGCLKGWTNNAANPVVSHWMELPPAPKEVEEV